MFVQSMKFIEVHHGNKRDISVYGQEDLKADFIMANPPFNQKAWRAENELKDDPRLAGYDVPPTSNANYGWILVPSKYIELVIFCLSLAILHI